MAAGADRTPAGPAVVVMNPRFGRGKVDRFRLVERARAAGAQVRLAGADQDPATTVQTCIIHYADLLIMPMLMLDPLRGRGFALARSA